jgi:hypothetical protein
MLLKTGMLEKLTFGTLSVDLGHFRAFGVPPIVPAFAAFTRLP